MKHRNQNGDLPGPEFFQKEALTKLIHGDLFSYKNPVIPIKTRGRSYGSISIRVQEMGVKIPDIPHLTAAFKDPYIFIALWGDEGEYSPEDIFDCAAAGLLAASLNQIPLVAFPVLGGKSGDKYLWAAEKGLFVERENIEEAMGFSHVSDHVFVTNKH